MKKYELIVEDIKTKILTQKYKVGEMIPSEAQLQSDYDVSRHTVRQALSILVNEGYVRKEQGSGTFVDDAYLDNKKHDKKTIGIVTTYFSDYIFPSIIRGIEHTLRENGYSLLLASTNNDLNQERQVLEMMLNQNVEGLIVEPTKSNQFNTNLPYYLTFKQREIPIVMINAYYEEIKFPYLVMDDEKSGYLVTKHLIDHGHKNIMVITKSDDMQGKLRMTGYITAHSEAKLQFKSSYVFNYTTETKDETVEEAVKHLQKHREITAIVCYNDELANRFVRDLAKIGFKVPNDVSIVGIDNAYISYAGEIALTTVAHPQEQMGIDAANMIIKAIRDQATLDNKIYDVALIDRNSVIDLETKE